MRRANPPEAWTERAMLAARDRLRDLIVEERKRARLHIELIRRFEPSASADRVARLILDRFVTLAQVEGGVTGALGFLGVPVHTLLFTYFEVAMVVSVAEAYGRPLEGDSGESELLSLLGVSHGRSDLARNGPRVLGALAKSFAVRHGFETVGRLVPILAAPVAARINKKAMQRTGQTALQTFGGVVSI